MSNRRETPNRIIAVRNGRAFIAQGQPCAVTSAALPRLAVDVKFITYRHVSANSSVGVALLFEATP